MRNDWWSCDGRGGAEPYEKASEEVRSAEVSVGTDISRRTLLATAALSALAWTGTKKSALAQVAFSPGSHERDVFVVVFLRGGMDGVNVVVPYAEDSYHSLRPTLGLSPPKDDTKPVIDRTLDLDGFFGINPALAPILPLFREGLLGFVHACGSEDRTRSHFEAMNAMERGLATAKGDAANGWLARYLNASDPVRPSPLRAVALTNIMPDSLRGATHATALQSLSDFRLDYGSDELRGGFVDELRGLYQPGKDEVSEAGRQTIQVLDVLKRLDPAKYVPANGAAYPESDIADALKQVAFLVKTDLGLEVACIDKGGWDTHFGQGRSEGLLTALLGDLSQGLAAFAKDLAGEMKRVTVVAMTEFGRRCYENSTLGTDHGRGSVMTILGGGTIGGKVHGVWPGLRKDQLEEPGDLKVTTDYRSVLSDVLTKRMGFSNLSEVFPGYSMQPTNVIRSG